jgi:hypothetical protein
MCALLIFSSLLCSFSPSPRLDISGNKECKFAIKENLIFASRSTELPLLFSQPYSTYSKILWINQSTA